LEPGIYLVKLKLLNDTRIRIDCLVLRTQPIAVEKTTWGQIKYLYY